MASTLTRDFDVDQVLTEPSDLGKVPSTMNLSNIALHPNDAAIYNAKLLLREIERTRGTGQTSMLVNARALAGKGVLVLGHYMSELAGAHTVTVNTLSKLTGQPQPLLFDTSAIVALLTPLLEELASLKAKVDNKTPEVVQSLHGIRHAVVKAAFEIEARFRARDDLIPYQERSNVLQHAIDLIDSCVELMLAAGIDPATIRLALDAAKAGSHKKADLSLLEEKTTDVQCGALALAYTVMNQASFG